MPTLKLNEGTYLVKSPKLLKLVSGTYNSSLIFLSKGSILKILFSQQCYNSTIVRVPLFMVNIFWRLSTWYGANLLMVPGVREWLKCVGGKCWGRGSNNGGFGSTVDGVSKVQRSLIRAGTQAKRRRALLSKDAI